MSEIYKVNYTVNNNILKVFVFKGDKLVVSDDSPPTIDGKKIFTVEEFQKIQQNNTEVIYIDKLIHGDDILD